MSDATRYYETIVVGGGQAGLATGYYLMQEGAVLVVGAANAGAEIATEFARRSPGGAGQ